MGQQILIKLTLYFMEITLGYVVFLPFYPYHWTLLFPLLIMTLLILIIALPFLKFFQRNSFFLYYICLLLVVLIVHVIWFDLFFAFVITLFMGWRMINVISNQSLNHSWNIFFVTAITSVIYYIGLNMYQVNLTNKSDILLLILVQLFVTLVANSLSQPGKSSDKSSVIIFTFIVMTTATLILGFLLKFVVPILKLILAVIFGGIGRGFFYILMPLINLFQHTYKAKEARVGQFIDSLPKNNTMPQLTHEHHSYHLLWIIALTLLVIIISIVAFLFLRNKRLEFLINQQSLPTNNERLIRRNQLFSQTRKESPPRHDRVRMLFYQFQKKMKKLGYGRYRKETIEEWFQRIPKSSTNRIKSLYEKSRYGNQQLSKQEFSIYREQLKQLTNEFIQNKKFED